MHQKCSRAISSTAEQPPHERTTQARLLHGPPKYRSSGQGVDSDPRASEARAAQCKSAWPDQNLRAFGLLVKVDARPARNDLRKSPGSSSASKSGGEAGPFNKVRDSTSCLPETIMAGPGKRRASELWNQTCRAS